MLTKKTNAWPTKYVNTNSEYENFDCTNLRNNNESSDFLILDISQIAQT